MNQFSVPHSILTQTALDLSLWLFAKRRWTSWPVCWLSCRRSAIL